MQVFVRDNDVNSTLRVLEKKMQHGGTFCEIKRRHACEKPSGVGSVRNPKQCDVTARHSESEWSARDIKAKARVFRGPTVQV